MKTQINNTSCTGIVLAGGKALRMGMDKGLMEWKGKRLVEYSIETLKPFCNTIIISTNNDEYSSLGLPLVKDKHKEIGPMGGLYAGLNASTNEHNIVLSCDMPLVDTQIMKLILAHARNYQVVAPVFQENIIPVCSYYHQSVLEILDQEISNGLYKMKLFLKRLSVKEIQIKDRKLQYKLSNINTMDDFESLLNNEFSG